MLFCLLSRGSMGREKNDKPLPCATVRPNTFMRGSSSKDLLDNQSQEEQRREMLETVKQLTGGMDVERSITEADRNKTREAGERLYMSEYRQRFGLSVWKEKYKEDCVSKQVS